MTESMRQEIRSSAASGDQPAFVAAIQRVDSNEANEIVDALCILAYPNGCVELVDAFLVQGFAPDVRGKDGATILMWAAYWGSLPIIDRLLSAGAEVNARDVEGRTPLIFATEGQREETVKHLVLTGADPRQRDVQGRSAMSIAESWTTGLKLPFGMHLSVRRKAPGNPIARWLREHSTVEQVDQE